MNVQIIIAGAGISGLSLAVQLAENNIACVVLEARSNFSGPTSGVRVSVEGVRIFEKMNIRNLGENTENHYALRQNCKRLCCSASRRKKPCNNGDKIGNF